MSKYSEIHNPFNITKATDFTNQEIAEYWVDFHTGTGEDLAHYLNPTDLTPKYIIGGKGCGKTHLLRYFSYPLQKLRSNNNIKSIIETDKYIGLNIDLGAMNSARMFGCGISEDQWDAIFGYYLELFVCLNLIDVTENISDGLHLEAKVSEHLIDVIKKEICHNKEGAFNSFAELREYINDLKKNVDFHINNAALKRSIDFDDLKIMLSPGDVFFKLTHLITYEIKELQDLRFIFILDELEKLREYQKVYINTLVWDKRIPSTFWIGARTYGFTTRATKTGEILRNGSEMQEIRLDELMRENEERYRIFAINLCAKRLKDVIGDMPLDDDFEKTRMIIDKYFENFDETKLFIRLSKRKELPHQKSFKAKLKEGIERKLLKGISVDEIDKLFDEFVRSDNFLVEKYKIFHFYKQWSKTTSASVVLQSLKQEIKNYLDGSQTSKIKSYEEKYKIDFLAQLIFENNIKLYHYTGLVSFIKISSGNPRAFLVILKEIFERSKLNHENPFEVGSIIKVKSQSIGIYQASKWFYEDTEAYGDSGKMLYKCIYNLAELLQGIRFSDKPSETSPSSFSFKPEKSSHEADYFIRLAVIHRILILVSGRHDKNSDRIERAYQINRMLAPYFNLPISRRGIVPLNESFIEAIFNPQKHGEFQSLFNDFISKMNAPFGNDLQAEMF